MSDFIAKITATVDTTKAAAQLNALTKERSMLASNWTSLVSAITSPLGIASLATGGVVAAISAYRQSVEEMELQWMSISMLMLLLPRKL